MVGDIIVKPLITEKSTKDATIGKFTFVVAKNATKTMVRQAVAEKFNVHVISVATSIVKGRRKKSGKRRVEMPVSPWKKAIVGLRKGEKIDFFDVATSK